MRMTRKAWERMQERIGILITGEMPEPYHVLKEMLRGEKVIAIGDVVVENLLKVGIEPVMMVVDGKSMRQKREAPIEGEITVRNEASEVSDELMEAVKRGYRRILVDGEEDLASLPALLYADENSLIVYGQPSEGIMVIRPTKDIKKKVEETLALFER